MVKQIINYQINICCKNDEKEWETGLLPDTENWKDRQIDVVKTTNPFRLQQKGINIIFVICIHLHIKAIKIHTDNSIPTSVEWIKIWIYCCTYSIFQSFRNIYSYITVL